MAGLRDLGAKKVPEGFQKASGRVPDWFRVPEGLRLPIGVSVGIILCFRHVATYAFGSLLVLSWTAFWTLLGSLVVSHGPLGPL